MITTNDKYTEVSKLEKYFKPFRDNIVGIDLEFESPYGMQYGEFDPDSVIRQDGGSARIEFFDTENATFNYTPSEFSMQSWGHTQIENLPLSRLFTVPATGSSASTE